MIAKLDLSLRFLCFSSSVLYYIKSTYIFASHSGATRQIKLLVTMSIMKLEIFSLCHFIHLISSRSANTHTVWTHAYSNFFLAYVLWLFA